MEEEEKSVEILKEEQKSPSEILENLLSEKLLGRITYLENKKDLQFTLLKEHEIVYEYIKEAEAVKVARLKREEEQRLILEEKKRLEEEKKRLEQEKKLKLEEEKRLKLEEKKREAEEKKNQQREGRKKLNQNEDENTTRRRPKTEKLVRSLSKRRMNAINRSKPNFKEDLKKGGGVISSKDAIRTNAMKGENENNKVVVEKTPRRPLSVRNLKKDGNVNNPALVKKDLLSTKNLLGNVKIADNNVNKVKKNTNLANQGKNDKIEKKNFGKNLPDYQKFIDVITKKEKKGGENTPSVKATSPKKSPKKNFILEMEKGNKNSVIDKKKLIENKQVKESNVIEKNLKKKKSIKEEEKKNLKEEEELKKKNSIKKPLIENKILVNIREFF